MNRAFYYLYFLIVVSAIILGIGIDTIWREYNSTKQSSVDTPFLQLLNNSYLLEFDASDPDFNSVEIWLTKLVGNISIDTLSNYKLLNLNEFSDSHLYKKIKEDTVFAIQNSEGKTLNYMRLKKSNFVVYLEFIEEQEYNPIIYNFFIIVFYASITIMVFIWVWPLSRDLRRMQMQTHKVGKDGMPVKIEIPKRSAVYDLAKAYNRMTKRIHDLVKSHQEMTYAVSHELRTPLARMKFALEMAQETQDKDSIQTQLTSLKIDVSDMDSLVKQLLAYAGFGRGNGHLNIQPGDMLSMLEGLVNSLNKQYPEISIDLHSNIEDKTVYCEWHLMERAIFNLLQNAVRYAEKNIVVSLDTVKIYERDFVQIYIEDDGVGIPENERERVFSAFVRLRNHINSKKGGFGLGLSIVYRIMQWHKGKAYVESSSLGGAKFILMWPLNYIKKLNI